MILELSIDDYFSQTDSLPIVDVRSPGEFEKGHMLEAVNIPLFTNDERADVGTTYVKKSKEKAIELGYKYVTPKLDWFIEESKKVSGQSAIAIHCWRGGMRSHAFAEHLHENGFEKVYVITGGYKAYRNYVLSFFDQPFHFRVLGGYTGSGKTYILKQIAGLGKQVVDLEGLAHHKGSAFGAIGETAQPTVEQFENNLFSEMRLLDLKTPIWVEDESHNIGYVKIPITMFRQMRAQSVIFVDISKEERAKHLVGEYSLYGNSQIAKSIKGIERSLGGQNVILANEFLEKDNYYEVALLALKYYDKAYAKGVLKRDQDKVFTISLPKMDHYNNAKSIIKFVDEHQEING